MAILGERAATPEQNDQDQHEGQSAEGRSQRNASRTRRAISVLPRSRRIPHFPQAYKYQNQRPIGSQDRPRIKRRPPVRVQEHCAKRDQYHRQHKRSSSLSLTVSHRTPLLSLLRGGHKKSSAGRLDSCRKSTAEPSTSQRWRSRARDYARVADNPCNARSAEWRPGTESFGSCSTAWVSASCRTPPITMTSDATHWAISQSHAHSKFPLS